MLLYTFSSPELAPQVPAGPATAPAAPKRVAIARPTPAQPPRRLAALFSFAGG